MTHVTRAVTLLLTVCCLQGASAQAQTPKTVRNTQRSVEQQVRAGRDVVLDEKKPREIEAQFLSDLLQSYRPPANRPSRGIHVENAVISGSLTFEKMSVPYWLDLENCVFKGPVSFSASNFEKGLSLRGAVFMGSANFYEISVGGDLRVNKAEFQSNEETHFNNIRVTGVAHFYQTKFNGPFNLSNSEMNELACAPEDQKFGHTEFRNSADFYAIRVRGDASFTEASFDGPVNFSSIEIGKNLELTRVHFTNPSEIVGFFSMRVGGNVTLNETQFAGGFDLARAQVEGNLELSKTQAGNSNTNLTKTFSGMKVDTLIFQDAAVPPPYDLEGADYRHLYAQAKGQDVSLDLIKASTYSRSNYSSLEEYYRRVGSDAAADNVYLAGKEAERKKQYADAGIDGPYLWSLFLNVTVGYGKKPWRALVWSLIFILIGCAVFFKKDWMMLQRGEDEAHYEKSYNPLWYSIALFLPIVDIADAKIWTPKTDRRLSRHYMRAHIILGYLLVPIGLAAWTGLIK